MSVLEELHCRVVPEKISLTFVSCCKCVVQWLRHWNNSWENQSEKFLGSLFVLTMKEIEVTSVFSDSRWGALSPQVAFVEK